MQDHQHTDTAGLQSLPQEVMEFMDGERGRTLLVTGAPGTGKTLFTIRLLDVLARVHGEPLYVTSRVDEDVIVDMYMQRLRGLYRTNVLDVSTGPESLPWTAEEPFDVHNIDSLFDWIQSIETVSSHPVIAFDSWELICQHLSGGQSNSLDKDALNDKIATFARSGDVELVLVAESETAPELEYAVDGVVSLRTDSDDRGRTNRELVLEKLRGVRIENRRRPITLAGGRFDTFAPVEPHPRTVPSEAATWTPVTNSKAKFASGIPDLDDILGGGYNRGSTVHLELGRDLSRDTWSLALLPTVTNFLAEELGAVVLPPSESSPGLLHQYLDRVLPDGRFDALCEVFSTYSSSIDGPASSVEVTESDVVDQNDGRMTLLEPDGIDYSEYVSAVEQIRERSRGPIAQVLSMDATYEAIPEFCDRLGEWANDVALHNDLGVLVTKPTGDLRNHANRIADMHLHLEKRGKVIVVYGENPLTPILGVGMDTTGPIPEITLTEMV